MKRLKRVKLHNTILVDREVIFFQEHEYEMEALVAMQAIKIVSKKSAKTVYVPMPNVCYFEADDEPTSETIKGSGKAKRKGRSADKNTTGLLS